MLTATFAILALVEAAGIFALRSTTVVTTGLFLVVGLPILLYAEFSSVKVGPTGVEAKRQDATHALQWLGKAEQLRDSHFYSLKVDWELDPIRSTPEYKSLEARKNFPP